MARSHHRKKHKEHLRQFRNTQESTGSSRGLRKVTGLFTFIGGAIGFAVSYFAAQASVTWIFLGILAGSIAGYYIGGKVDSEKA